MPQRQTAFARRRRNVILAARAFDAARGQLRAGRDVLQPSLAHRCHRRGCYAAAFEAPTAHEKLESHVALRDWIRRRAGVD